jgi:hypothetical protein
MQPAVIAREHFVDPNSSALIFPERPGERADDQIRLLASAMLQMAEAVNNGRSVPEDTLAVLRAIVR